MSLLAQSGPIIAKALADEITHVYVEFGPSAANSAAPSEPTPAYFAALDGIAGDYVRVPRSGFVSYSPQSGHSHDDILSIFAQLSAGAGENGLDFMGGSASFVRSLTLVSAQNASPSSDVLISHLKIASGSQTNIADVDASLVEYKLPVLPA